MYFNASVHFLLLYDVEALYEDGTVNFTYSMNDSANKTHNEIKRIIGFYILIQFILLTKEYLDAYSFVASPIHQMRLDCSYLGAVYITIIEH